MSNLVIVRRLYDAFRARDRATLYALLAPDVEWVQNAGFPGGGTHVGVDAVLDGVFAALRRDWDGWGAAVHEWLDAGDAVVALGEYRGTYKSTGRQMVAAFAHVYRVRDGRIHRFEQYTDTVKVVEAMQDV